MNIRKTSGGKLPLLAAAVLALIANVKAQSSLSEGLLAYYPFSGNAEDATGNGHDGVVMDAVLTTNRFGQANRAYAFDGTNSAIVVSNSAVLQPLGDFSVSVWAVVQKAPVYTSYQDMGPMLTKGWPFAVNRSGWALLVLTGYSGPELEFVKAPLPQSPLSTLRIPIPTNRWFQTVFTFQHAWVLAPAPPVGSTGVASFYLNGVLVERQVKDFLENNDADDPLIMGGGLFGYSGNTNHFDGLLDDIRIYDRALSSNEVQQLYTEEAGPPVQPQTDTHKAIHLEFSQLTVGAEYQLQFSHNRHRWLNAGAPFTAAATTESETVSADHYDVKDVFWRLQVAP